MNRRRIYRFITVIAIMSLFIIVTSCGDPPNGHKDDEVSPADIENLSVVRIDPGTVLLSWTAPGDDGQTGTADKYAIRYSLDSATVSNWTSATPVDHSPVPSQAGGTDTCSVSGLSSGSTYYFAIKANDEAGNESGISNIVKLFMSTVIGIPTLNPSQCDEVSIPIVTNSMNNVAGVEMHIQYDNQKLTFGSVTSDYLTEYLITNETGGTVHITWASIAKPLSFEDNDTLAVLHFSNLDGTSALTFTGNNEIVDNEGDPLNVGFMDGTVTCQGGI